MSGPGRTDRDGPQGWERLWAVGNDVARFWSDPEPAVVEWVQSSVPDRCRVLDLGCGIGRHTTLFARLGLRSVGVDLSPSGLAGCVDRARRKGVTVSLVCSGMSRLPFADGAFDALLAFHVIYHASLAGMQAILAEIHRILQPASPLYLTFRGRTEETIARYRADVARGICREVEPFSFVYLQDAPHDKDIIHHYCDAREVRDLLVDFDVTTLLPVRTGVAGDGGIRHTSLHYHVHARRPDC